MLKQYLQECLEILDKNSQKTELQKFIIDCQNNLNPNDYSQDFFESLQNKTKEPMQIAIIGQFSSGKSTFLTLFWGKISFQQVSRPSLLKYAKFAMEKILS